MRKTEAYRLYNNWNYAQKLWAEKKKIHKLHGWKIGLMNVAGKAGMCSYTDKIIYLSSIFMRGHNCNFDKVKQALMHEIAHALKPGHGHDNIWKKQCRKIGGDTRLAITMVLPGMKWAMICPKCKWRHEYSYKPNIKRKICGICRGSLKVKYIP